MSSLSTALTVPDLWQQKAVNLLRAGHDVIVDAPTGAGKTFIFELLVEHQFSGKAVFTVPTRALANDKLIEWQSKGWNVGITTGDVSYNTAAPIVVATLETQKRALMTGRGPRLLVIDEYQMLADTARGVNYELALAAAPKNTQLLLLSGSVANPQDVEEWLRRCGRSALTIRHPRRPVPLDEINLEALPPLSASKMKHLRGRWPRYIARAIEAGLGPILIFASRRHSAEALARTLASTLSEPNPLILTTEQQAIAGKDLSRCLKNRIAFHHSGMSYAQRAGIVEPLAKNNQLKAIIATTGLAAGINFSMRSVLVLEREYRIADTHRMLRPDELLQMFGRAGRRGLDERGSVLYLDNKPRLIDARPLGIKRGNIIDWPSLLTVMQAAVDDNQSPLEATRRLTARLFTREPIRLGLDDFLNQRASRPEHRQADLSEQKLSGGTVVEFQNREGVWERRRAAILFKLKDTYYLDGGTWRPGLSNSKIVSSLKIGSIAKWGTGNDRYYGIDAPIAMFPTDSKDDRLLITAWLRRALREKQRAEGQKVNVPKAWALEKIEQLIIPQIAQLTHGGTCIELNERNNTLIARLDFSNAQIHAFKEMSGKGLLNPVIRKRRINGTDTSQGTKGTQKDGRRLKSVAEEWHALGLIDRHARPTRRGIIFSFFNHGEGLAIAAALEEKNYPIEELLYDLANIRAGHRFNALALAGRPLTAICHSAYGLKSIPGYLRRGLPEDYGEGASEILYNIEHQGTNFNDALNEELSNGDVERAQVEWRSLRAHIATAPKYDWPRWQELQAACRQSISEPQQNYPFENLPSLTTQQKR